MNKKLAITSWILGASLAVIPLVGYSSGDADADRSRPKAFVKDSAITTKIKTKLAADHITSLGRIHVDTDASGVVWLSGTARSHEDIEKAVSIAKDTEGVVSVKNHLKVRKDD